MPQKIWMVKELSFWFILPVNKETVSPNKQLKVENVTASGIITIM